MKIVRLYSIFVTLLFVSGVLLTGCSKPDGEGAASQPTNLPPGKTASDLTAPMNENVEKAQQSGRQALPPGPAAAQEK